MQSNMMKIVVKKRFADEGINTIKCGIKKNCIVW